MFLFKRKKIVLDCFTNNSFAYEYAMIDKASKFYPDWWKNMPKEYQEGISTFSTMKKCQGIIDYYQHGFIMPLWADLNIDVKNKRYGCQFADQTKVEFHTPNQWGAFVSPHDYAHLKIISPWRLQTKRDIKFNFIKPYWNFPLTQDFSIPEGIIDFKYQTGTHVNMFLNLKNDATISLKFGTPLIHLIPLTEDEIVLNYHLISDQEFNQLSASFKFQNTYSEMKKLVQSKQKKCPFGFGIS